MGKVSLRRGSDAARRKAAETIEATIIHQRQKELTVGRWDFVVFGPSRDRGKAVARVCVAEHMIIQKAPVYLAAVGDPSVIGEPGLVPIEELTGGDVAEELFGLEVYHISPLRPIDVVERKENVDLDRLRGIVIEEYSGLNIAIIETPDEAAWSVSALQYLNDCDDIFPDQLMSAIRSTMRDTSITFRQPPGLIN
ncbi:MAG: hypothetical protein HZB29_03715 [Nitrospinae bacterium]|nr:hypothetical protein [Nitrospinota bacterium]